MMKTQHQYYFTNIYFNKFFGEEASKPQQMVFLNVLPSLEYLLMKLLGLIKIIDLLKKINDFDTHIIFNNIKKTKIFLIFFILILFLSETPAYAGSIPVFFSWGGEKIIKLKDFPDTPNFQTPNGAHVDVGYRYKQVTVFFIPIWNYDFNWCGYIGSDNTYIDVSREELSTIAASANIELPNSPSIPFWDSIGGKLVWGLIILIYMNLPRETSNNKLEGVEKEKEKELTNNIKIFKSCNKCGQDNPILNKKNYCSFCLSPFQDQQKQSQEGQNQRHKGEEAKLSPEEKQRREREEYERRQEQEDWWYRGNSNSKSSESKKERQTYTYNNSVADDPWTVLGVSRNASIDEIKAAYKERVKEYHPDKVNHLGAKLRELAEQELKIINAAYDKLKKY